MFTDVFLYSWLDVAPSRQPFDMEKARAILSRCLAPHGPDDASFERALLLEFGPWIYGWEWGRRHPGVGGPPTTDASVLNGLVKWRWLLEEVEATFAKVPLTADDVRPVALARANGQTISVIEDYAQKFHKTILSADEWLWPYVREGQWPMRQFPSFLQWYLESIGVVPFAARMHVNSALQNPPKSLPDHLPAFLRQLAGGTLILDLGTYVPGRHPPPVVPDWVQLRDKVIKHFTSDVRVSSNLHPIQVDAHSRYINETERAQNPRRADAMAVALDACRASAAAGEPLTRANLASWVQIALVAEDLEPFIESPVPEQFRAVLEQRARDLDAALDVSFEEANNTERRDIALRALLIYLDVFYLHHNGTEGNHRAARLALDHTLTRAGLGLHAAVPVLALPLAITSQHTGTPTALKALARILESLIGVS